MRWFLLVYEFNSLVSANIMVAVEEHCTKQDIENRIETWTKQSSNELTFSITNNESVIDAYNNEYWDMRIFDYDLGVECH